MKKETAIEWLIGELNGYDEDCEIFRIAKAMEKEQIENAMAHAITFGWELSHYHRDKQREVLLQMQKDFITSVIEGVDK